MLWHLVLFSSFLDLNDHEPNVGTQKITAVYFRYKVSYLLADVHCVYKIHDDLGS